MNDAARSRSFRTLARMPASRRPRDRHGHDRAAPAAILSPDCERAGVGTDDGLRDHEPEAEATVRTRAGRIAGMEGSKETFLHAARDAGTAVRHLDRDVCGSRGDGYGDAAAGRSGGELHGVVDDIEQRLDQTL